MDQTLKMGVMLLNSLIYHYHGLDPDEEELLKQTADKYDAVEEMLWANNFIAEDYISAFQRSRIYLKSIFKSLSKEEVLDYLEEIWIGNYDKGYVTEMETTAMKHLANDWGVESEFEKIITADSKKS